MWFVPFNASPVTAGIRKLAFRVLPTKQRRDGLRAYNMKVVLELTSGVIMQAHSRGVSRVHRERSIGHNLTGDGAKRVVWCGVFLVDSLKEVLTRTQSSHVRA